MELQLQPFSMKILVATGRLAEEQVRKSAKSADVLVLDVEVASFITPEMLRIAAPEGYDIILVPGAITSDFSTVERELKAKIRLGSKHAIDLGYVLDHIDEIELSKTTPACVLLAESMRRDALSMVDEIEAGAKTPMIIKGVKIGGNSRMKVLAEIVDATRLSDDELSNKIAAYEAQGADMIDLGIPLDCEPEEVESAVRTSLKTTRLPVSVDTMRPDLIKAGVEAGADMVLSLNGDNIPIIGEVIAKAGVPAVVIPGPRSGIIENIAAAKELGLDIIADPVLEPPLLGITTSIRDYLDFQNSYSNIPLFFGVGNVTELIDADSPGVNGLLGAMAAEVGASILFTPEYSDKAKGSVYELRIASEMMCLAKMRNSPPKDLGIDLLIMKEKRRRPDDKLPEEFIEARKGHVWAMDPAGCFKIGIVDGKIHARHDKVSVMGTSAIDVLNTLLDSGLVTRLDHAGYLGRELEKAELAIKLGRSYSQDDPF
jgi:dihydropteroate synthase-like protein